MSTQEELIIKSELPDNEYLTKNVFSENNISVDVLNQIKKRLQHQKTALKIGEQTNALTKKHIKVLEQLLKDNFKDIEIYILEFDDKQGPEYDGRTYVYSTLKLVDDVYYDLQRVGITSTMRHIRGKYIDFTQPIEIDYLFTELIEKTKNKRTKFE